MKKIIDGLLIALQLLTTIPFHSQIEWDKDCAKWSVRFFPLVGLIGGILIAAQLILLLEYTHVSTVIIAFWILFFGVLYTGGLHLDGWMDMSDAIFSYRDQERKLEIMSDSRVGAFGVISLLFLLGFRFLFIYEIIEFSSLHQLLLIILIPFLAKAALTALLIEGKFAKSTGMAAAYKDVISKKDLRYVGGFIVLVSGVMIMVDFSLTTPIMILIIASIFLYWFLKSIIYKEFGGITGDTLGALAEGEETFLWLVLWLLHYFAMV